MFDQQTAAASTQQHINKMCRLYRRVFGGAAGKAVLADLSTFCWAMHSTWAPGDPYEAARRDGQRSVILRVYELLNMTPDDVAALAYCHSQQPIDILEASDD